MMIKKIATLALATLGLASVAAAQPVATGLGIGQSSFIPGTCSAFQGFADDGVTPVSKVCVFNGDFSIHVCDEEPEPAWASIIADACHTAKPIFVNVDSLGNVTAVSMTP